MNGASKAVVSFMAPRGNGAYERLRLLSDFLVAKHVEES